MMLYLLVYLTLAVASVLWIGVLCCFAPERPGLENRLAHWEGEGEEVSGDALATTGEAGGMGGV